MVRLLQNARFKTAMCQILIHTPRFALRARHRYTHLLRVIQEIVPPSEPLVENWVAPGSNDFDLGLEGIEAQLEANLVVALAGTAVRDVGAGFFLGHGNLGAGDDWPRKGGAEEVGAFVDGVALDGGEAEFWSSTYQWLDIICVLFRGAWTFNEFPANILNVAFLGSELKGLLLCSLKVLFLANICHEAYHTIALLDEPSTHL